MPTKTDLLSQDRYQPLGDDAVTWLDIVRANLKVGIEFESNLKPDAKLCPLMKANKCPKTNCRFFEEGCKQDHHGEVYSAVSGEVVCRLAENCEGHPGDCNGCPDFFGADRVPGPCSKQHCKAFMPQCEGCSELSTAKMRAHISKELEPTNSLTHIGKYGVNEVKEDGSLIESGVEVTTCGRRFDVDRFNKQNEHILGVMRHYGGYVDGHCGAHIHTLLSYTGKPGRHFNTEIEEPIPQIIMANLHQITRRFAPELFWITSAMRGTKDSITRFSQFRRGVLPTNGSEMNMMFSPSNRSMQEIATESQRLVSGRYCLMNYSECDWRPDGEMQVAHIEFRFPDMHFAPIVHTAVAGMLSAMWLKATKLSEYGVMSAGDKQWLEETAELFMSINNAGNVIDAEGNVILDNVRSGNRLAVSPCREHQRLLIRRSHILIDFLRQELMMLDNGDDRLCKILHSLADKPLSMRPGTDEEVNGSIVCERTAVCRKPFGAAEKLLLRAINLGEICGKTEEEWKMLAEEELRRYVDMNNIDEVLDTLREKAYIQFDATAQSFIVIDRK